MINQTNGDIKMADIVVLGAGITGIAFANAARTKFNVKVFEKNNHIGGKCYSYSVQTKAGTFTFDIGGHWLHTNSYKEVVNLYTNLQEYKRKAYVQIGEDCVEYPIQNSYIYLSNHSIVEKIMSEMCAIQQQSGPYANYEEMLQGHYGKTLYDLFFKSYNQKLFNLQDLSTINYGFLESKRNLSIKEKRGYNSTFMYSSNGRGAIQFVQQLSNGVDVRLNSTPSRIYPREKRIEFSNGEQIIYDYLVSTIPLNKLISITEDDNNEVSHEARMLKSSRGLIYNMGIKMNRFIARKSWIYYPDKNIPFYRVGVYSNIDSRMAPKDYASIYVECIVHADYKDIVKCLINKGIIEKEKDIIFSRYHLLEENYCFYNSATTHIMDWLNLHDIYSIGRYGAWRWSSMHEDIHQAVNLSEHLQNVPVKSNT